MEWLLSKTDDESLDDPLESDEEGEDKVRKPDWQQDAQDLESVPYGKAATSWGEGGIIGKKLTEKENGGGECKNESEMERKKDIKKLRAGRGTGRLDK